MTDVLMEARTEEQAGMEGMADPVTVERSITREMREDGERIVGTYRIELDPERTRLRPNPEAVLTLPVERRMTQDRRRGDRRREMEVETRDADQPRDDTEDARDTEYQEKMTDRLEGDLPPLLGLNGDEIPLPTARGIIGSTTRSWLGAWSAGVEINKMWIEATRRTLASIGR